MSRNLPRLQNGTPSGTGSEKQPTPVERVRRPFWSWLAFSLLLYFFIAPVGENIATCGGMLRFGRDCWVHVYVPDDMSVHLLWVDGRMVRPVNGGIVLWVNRGSHSLVGIVDCKPYRQDFEVTYQGERYLDLEFYAK